MLMAGQHRLIIGVIQNAKATEQAIGACQERMYCPLQPHVRLGNIWQQMYF